MNLDTIVAATLMERAHERARLMATQRERLALATPHAASRKASGEPRYDLGFDWARRVWHWVSLAARARQAEAANRAHSPA